MPARAALPLKPGFRPGPDVDPGPPPGPPAAAGSLAGLAGDFVFCHYGCFFAHGGLARDPLRDYADEGGDVCGVRTLLLPAPALAARHCLPAERRMLLAVPRPLWPGLSRFLAGVGAADRPSGRLWRAVAQEVPVPDVAGADPSAAAVPVFFFGVDGTDALWAVAPAAGPYPLLPRRLRLRPRPESGRAAAALFGPDGVLRP